MEHQLNGGMYVEHFCYKSKCNEKRGKCNSLTDFVEISTREADSHDQTTQLFVRKCTIHVVLKEREY